MSLPLSFFSGALVVHHLYLCGRRWTMWHTSVDDVEVDDRCTAAGAVPMDGGGGTRVDIFLDSFVSTQLWVAFLSALLLSALISPGCLSGVLVGPNTYDLSHCNCILLLKVEVEARAVFWVEWRTVPTYVALRTFSDAQRT